VRERAWSLSRCRTADTVTISRGVWWSNNAVHDQRYKCHNLRDGGHVTPATMLTTPRLLQRQQQAYIGSESRFLPNPPALDAPVKGVSVGISPSRLVRKKLEWCGYRMVKNFEDIFIRFDTIHERDRHIQTHRHRMTA